jgi:4-amino-4-deoxy-L-arabinose transferase-like glycosyltransferase
MYSIKNFFTQDITKYKSGFILYCILFVIALGLRLFFLYAIDTVFILFKYIVFAHQIIQGKDLGERLLDLSPFYLSFITFLVTHFNVEHVHIKFIQLLVGVINCLLIFTIGKKLLNSKIAFIGALMYATYGNIIVLESTFEPFVFIVLFNLLSLYCLTCITRESFSSPKIYTYSIFAGLFTGLSIITKPNYLLFIPVAMVWLLFLAEVRRSFQKRIILTLLFLMLTAVVVFPVTIRNYIRFHDVVLVTADYGKVFFHGNAKNATGFMPAALPDQDINPPGRDDPDYAHVTFRTVASEIVGRKLLPSEAARFWIKVTLQDIVSRPREYLLLELKKIHLFFHDYEVHLVASAFWEYKKVLSYPFLRYGIISSLGLLGMLLAAKKFNKLFLLYGVFFSYFLSGLLLLVTSRYRSPAVPSLCLFAGYSLYSFIEYLMKKKLYVAALCLLSLIGLFAINYLPYKEEIANLEESMQQVFVNSIQRRIFDRFPPSPPSQEGNSSTEDSNMPNK